MPTRPNILLVVVDDLRFDDFGAGGHPFARTPNLDRLAREGGQFKNFFAVTPLCSPSRANILTGLYTRHHGILDNTERGPRSHELRTFARQLHDAGYNTGFIGKWHMGNDPTPRPGFDFWVSMKGQGEVAANAPFLLMLSHKALHPNILQQADGRTVAIDEGGFIPAERHQKLYLDDPLPRRDNYGVPPRENKALQRSIEGLPPLGIDTVTPDQTIRDRLRMLAAVDEGLGRILEALQKRGVLDQTAVMLVGDNGYFYGEHGLIDAKPSIDLRRRMETALDELLAPREPEPKAKPLARP